MNQLDPVAELAGADNGKPDSNPASKGVHLSPVQSAILVGLGLQHKTSKNCPARSTSPFRKLWRCLEKIGLEDEEAWDPTVVGLDDDLEEAGNEALAAFKKKQRELINGLDLTQYAINAGDEDLKRALVPLASGSVVQVRNTESSKRKRYEAATGTASELNAGREGRKDWSF
ncbi:hypothetical protein BC829DRAFT_455266 [Chytridium lagenaria]|nr:hypothetical protein BC829DRAFT_455266 [Chytridium lagenaria]